MRAVVLLFALIAPFSNAGAEEIALFCDHGEAYDIDTALKTVHAYSLKGERVWSEGASRQGIVDGCDSKIVQFVHVWKSNVDFGENVISKGRCGFSDRENEDFDPFVHTVDWGLDGAGALIQNTGDSGVACRRVS